MDLAGGLGLGERELVSFVGAGGKKTAMSRLVEQATAVGLGAGYTTTAHMPPPSDIPFVTAESGSLRSRLAAEPTPIAFAREYVSNPARVDEKVRGFRPSTLDSLFETDRFDWLLVKADGARMREFKAPGSNEPPIPTRSTVVVPVVSAHAIGEQLRDDIVHRIDRVAACTDLQVGDRLTPDAVGRVLAHPNGGLKHVPDAATVVPIVNKADTPRLERLAKETLSAAFDCTSRFERGLVTSFETGRIVVR